MTNLIYKKMKYFKLYENYNKYRLFHETSQENYASIMKDGFKLIDGERAYSDPLVPYGIFFKDNDKSIGLFDNAVQIPVEVEFENPIIFDDRDDVKRYMSEKDSCFKENIELHDSIDDKYGKMSDDMIEEFSKSDMSRADKAEKLKTDHTELLKVWSQEIDEAGKKCRECITNYLLSNNYDSMIILKDKGSWGREVKTYISLKDDNIKIIE